MKNKRCERILEHLYRCLSAEIDNINMCDSVEFSNWKAPIKKLKNKTLVINKRIYISYSCRGLYKELIVYDNKAGIGRCLEFVNLEDITDMEIMLHFTRYLQARNIIS